MAKLRLVHSGVGELPKKQKVSMKTWTLAQAKADYQRGLLKSVCIQHPGAPNVPWVVVVQSVLSVDGVGYLIDARSKQPRVFKTLDAAYMATRQIGFEYNACWLPVLASSPFSDQQRGPQGHE